MEEEVEELNESDLFVVVVVPLEDDIIRPLPP